MIPVIGMLSLAALLVSLVGVFFKRWRRPARIGLAVSLAIFVGALIVSKDRASASRTRGTQNSGLRVAVNGSVQPIIQARSNWAYSEERDPMRGTVTRLAQTQSVNELQLGFPYGLVHGYLMVRQSASDGLNIALRINGQFVCNTDAGDYLSAKFDQGPIERFRCANPEDGSPGWLFVVGSRRFLRQLLRSSKVIIEANYFENGRQQLVFDISGLKWPQR